MLEQLYAKVECLFGVRHVYTHMRCHAVQAVTEYVGNRLFESLRYGVVEHYAFAHTTATGNDVGKAHVIHKRLDYQYEQ